MLATAIILCALFLSVIAAPSKKDAGPVTCGSAIKLVHKETVSSSNYYDQIFEQRITYVTVTGREEICIHTLLLGGQEVDSSLSQHTKFEMIKVN